MGAKRPLEVEDFPELSFKQPKQIDYNNELIFHTEDFPSHTTTLRVDSPVEANSNFLKSHFDGGLENDDTVDTSTDDKQLESNGEDTQNQDTSFLSYFRRYIDFTIPCRPPEQFEDPYVILLNSPPRKEVPIGPDHQAEIPQWHPNAREKYFSGSDEKLIGTCIIPMPDLSNSSIVGILVGLGRADCSCPDVGSIRCGQEHVKEAREKLREKIGEEIFTELGFYEMGDEVAARNWTADEEEIFHRVVFSNPVSLGRDYWKELGVVFPFRTKKELVSYYFNVFMLRRRAVQNRSRLLDIDSDDDEEREVERAHVGYIGEEEEGSLGLDPDPDLVGGSGFDPENGDVCKEGD